MLLDDIQKRVLLLASLQREYLLSRAESNPISLPHLNLSHPEIVEECYARQLAAGADIILSNTGRANRGFLGNKIAAKELAAMNAKGVQIARAAAGEEAYVAAHVIPPEISFRDGNFSFEQIYDDLAQQIEILLQEKIDLLCIGPTSELKNLQIAVIAANTLRGDVPLMMIYNFKDGCHTRVGVNAELAATAFDSLDVDIICAQCACRQKPRKACLCQHTNKLVAMVAHPEARQDMEGQIKSLVVHGACIIVLPESVPFEKLRHYRQLAEGKCLFRSPISFPLRIGGTSKVVKIGGRYHFVKIGERINPTGRKRLADSIVKGRTDLILKEARDQQQAGAQALDVNIGAPLADEKSMMAAAVHAIQSEIALPLVCDSNDPAVIEAGLQAATGKVLINSVNAKESSIEAILPLVKRYGAAVILLTIDEQIPASAEERLAIARRLVEACRSYRIPRNDLIIDPAALAVASSPGCGQELLRAIGLIKEELGLPISLGVSNVSFGLPQRALVHNTFLVQAISMGLNAAIMNPLDADVHKMILAADLFSGRDQDAMKYVRGMRKLA